MEINLSLLTDNAEDNTKELTDAVFGQTISVISSFDGMWRGIYGDNIYSTPPCLTRYDARIKLLEWLSEIDVDKFSGCPHCGSYDLDGPHFIDYVGDVYTPSWWISCTNCPCSMDVSGESVVLLLEAWNKRCP